MMADRGHGTLLIANYNRAGRAMLGYSWCFHNESFCCVDDAVLQ
jgi:hypothetical protein